MDLTFYHLIAIFAIMHSFTPSVGASSSLVVQIIDYENTYQTKFDGTCCDSPDPRHCNYDPCDITYLVCFDNSTDKNCSTKTYAFGVDVTITVDLTDLNFKDAVPMKFIIGDIDAGPKPPKQQFPELVDIFKYVYPIAPASVRGFSDTSSLIALTGSRTKYPSGLTIEVKSICNVNYFGSYCNIYCVPTDDCTGHYKCDEQGVKTCYSGWAGINCNEATANVKSCDDCRNNGICILNGTNLTLSYCCCGQGFFGQRCEEVGPNPAVSPSSSGSPLSSISVTPSVSSSSLSDLSSPSPEQLQIDNNSSSSQRTNVSATTLLVMPTYVNPLSTLPTDGINVNPTSNNQTVSPATTGVSMPLTSSSGIYASTIQQQTYEMKSVTSKQTTFSSVSTPSIRTELSPQPQLQRNDSLNSTLRSENTLTALPVTLPSTQTAPVWLTSQQSQLNLDISSSSQISSQAFSSIVTLTNSPTTRQLVTNMNTFSKYDTLSPPTASLSIPTTSVSPFPVNLQTGTDMKSPSISQTAAPANISSSLSTSVSSLSSPQTAAINLNATSINQTSWPATPRVTSPTQSSSTPPPFTSQKYLTDLGSLSSSNSVPILLSSPTSTPLSAATPNKVSDITSNSNSPSPLSSTVLNTIQTSAIPSSVTQQAGTVINSTSSNSQTTFSANISSSISTSIIVSTSQMVVTSMNSGLPISSASSSIQYNSTTPSQTTQLDQTNVNTNPRSQTTLPVSSFSTTPTFDTRSPVPQNVVTDIASNSSNQTTTPGSTPGSLTSTTIVIPLSTFQTANTNTNTNTVIQSTFPVTTSMLTPNTNSLGSTSLTSGIEVNSTLSNPRYSSATTGVQSSNPFSPITGFFTSQQVQTNTNLSSSNQTTSTVITTSSPPTFTSSSPTPQNVIKDATSNPSNSTASRVTLLPVSQKAGADINSTSISQTISLANSAWSVPEYFTSLSATDRTATDMNSLTNNQTFRTTTPGISSTIQYNSMTPSLSSQQITTSNSNNQTTVQTSISLSLLTTNVTLSPTRQTAVSDMSTMFSNQLISITNASNSVSMQSVSVAASLTIQPAGNNNNSSQNNQIALSTLALETSTHISINTNSSLTSSSSGLPSISPMLPSQPVTSQLSSDNATANTTLFSTPIASLSSSASSTSTLLSQNLNSLTADVTITATKLNESKPTESVSTLFQNQPTLSTSGGVVRNENTIQFSNSMNSGSSSNSAEVNITINPTKPSQSVDITSASMQSSITSRLIMANSTLLTAISNDTAQFTTRANLSNATLFQNATTGDNRLSNENVTVNLPFPSPVNIIVNQSTINSQNMTVTNALNVTVFSSVTASASVQSKNETFTSDSLALTMIQSLNQSIPTDTSTVMPVPWNVNITGSSVNGTYSDSGRNSTVVLFTTDSTQSAYITTPGKKLANESLTNNSPYSIEINSIWSFTSTSLPVLQNANETGMPGNATYTTTSKNTFADLSISNSARSINFTTGRNNSPTDSLTSNSPYSFQNRSMDSNLSTTLPIIRNLNNTVVPGNDMNTDSKSSTIGIILKTDSLQTVYLTTGGPKSENITLTPFSTEINSTNSSISTVLPNLRNFNETRMPGDSSYSDSSTIRAILRTDSQYSFEINSSIPVISTAMPVLQNANGTGMPENSTYIGSSTIRASLITDSTQSVYFTTGGRNTANESSTSNSINSSETNSPMPAISTAMPVLRNANETAIPENSAYTGSSTISASLITDSTQSVNFTTGGRNSANENLTTNSINSSEINTTMPTITTAIPVLRDANGTVMPENNTYTFGANLVTDVTQSVKPVVGTEQKSGSQSFTKVPDTRTSDSFITSEMITTALDMLSSTTTMPSTTTIDLILKSIIENIHELLKNSVDGELTNEQKQELLNLMLKEILRELETGWSADMSSLISNVAKRAILDRFGWKLTAKQSSTENLPTISTVVTTTVVETSRDDNETNSVTIIVVAVCASFAVVLIALILLVIVSTVRRQDKRGKKLKLHNDVLGISNNHSCYIQHAVAHQPSNYTVVKEVGAVHGSCTRQFFEK